MLRLPGKLLGPLAAVALAVHAWLLVPAFHGAWFQPDQWQQNAVYLALALGVILAGRLFLGLLPPGEPGAHSMPGLDATLATSLLLGWALVGIGYAPLAFLLLSGAPRWSIYGLPAAMLLVLAGLRLASLPGAMVPRHGLPVERPGGLERGLAAVLLVWLAYTLFSRACVPAWSWLALGILLVHGLRQARRARAGRWLLLCGTALLGNPGGKLVSEFFGLADELGVAASLGLGAAASIAWLRRADRRAGLLAVLGCTGPLLRTWDPLALAGLSTLFLASHRRQRGFVLRAGLLAAACLSFPRWFGLHLGTPRGRALDAGTLLERAGDGHVWGLLWPFAALGVLAAGAALLKPGRPWAPGTIEEPRRELGALLGLLALSGVALALPISPWEEREALVILAPLGLLIGGLALIPAQRVEQRYEAPASSPP